VIKGSSVRRAHHRVDALFVDRWSPRAMSGEAIATDELLRLFEAARWAPSSYNAQPWRMLYALREHAEWPTFLDLLSESNKAWARRAGALVLFVSKKINDRTGQPSMTHSFDAGAAWAFFGLQGHLNGYAVHGMQGFDYVRAQRELQIPDEFRVEAMVAVGKPGSTETLPPPLQERESPNDRRPISPRPCAKAGGRLRVDDLMHLPVTQRQNGYIIAMERGAGRSVRCRSLRPFGWVVHLSKPQDRQPRRRP